MFVRDGFSRWENTGMGVRTSPISDTADADIVVRWIDHFDIDRAGQTDLTWDQLGRVRKATISLALRTNTGLSPAGRGAPRRGGARDRSRAGHAPLGRLERRDVSRYPDRHTVRAGSSHGPGALPAPARPPPGHGQHSLNHLMNSIPHLRPCGGL